MQHFQHNAIYSKSNTVHQLVQKHIYCLESALITNAFVLIGILIELYH